MKNFKFIVLFLFIFSFLGLFNINTNFAQANSESGCTGSGPYSTTTGKLCADTVTTACKPGDLFSFLTGKPCGETRPNFCVVSDLTLGSRGENVKTFQTELNAQGANLKVDGSYGPLTQTAATKYCKIYLFPNPSPVVISGVSGPQSLDINQEGTWTVTAYNKEGGNLSYSVIWGDEYSVMPMMTDSMMKDLSVQQSATFTHSYSSSGIYKPIFVVTSENTIRCITTPCPSNAGRAQTSLSVKVGETTVCVDSPCIYPPKPIPLPVVEASTISSISPQSGPTGTEVTISGTGLYGASINFGGHVLLARSYTDSSKYSSVIINTSDTELTFTVPSNFNNCTSGMMCTDVYIPVNAGKYNVYVANKNGSSNSMVFTVTGATY